MAAYKMSSEEKEYLKNYDISEFDRPSIAADIAIFSVLQEPQKPSRRLPKQELKMLLIQRGTYPYKDLWALPGGFCRPGEDVDQTARRELFEETNVENAYLKLAGVYGEKDRDPRGWIISTAYLALIDGTKCRLRAGSDAWKALWFGITVEKEEIENTADADCVKLISRYNIALNNLDEGICLKASVRENKIFENYHEKVSYEIEECEGLAFDHATVILQSLLSLREQVNDNLRFAFDLMPESFTLTSLQTAFELILGKKMITPNFRRKISDYVIETEEIIEGEMHRPAKLYKRNAVSFYS